MVAHDGGDELRRCQEFFQFCYLLRQDLSLGYSATSSRQSRGHLISALKSRPAYNIDELMPFIRHYESVQKSLVMNKCGRQMHLIASVHKTGMGWSLYPLQHT